MLKTITLLAVVGLSALAMSTAAQAKIKTLSECYDKVIANCNTKANPQGCAKSGMDQCDKVFPKPLVIDPTRLDTLVIE